MENSKLIKRSVQLALLILVLFAAYYYLSPDSEVSVRPANTDTANYTYTISVGQAEIGREANRYDIWNDNFNIDFTDDLKFVFTETWAPEAVERNEMSFHVTDEVAESMRMNMKMGDEIMVMDMHPPEGATEHFEVSVTDPNSPDDLLGFIFGSTVTLAVADADPITLDLIQGSTLHYSKNIIMPSGTTKLKVNASKSTMGKEGTYMENKSWETAMPEKIIDPTLNLNNLPTQNSPIVLFDGVQGGGDSQYHLKVSAYAATPYKKWAAGLKDVAVDDNNVRIDIELRDVADYLPSSNEFDATLNHEMILGLPMKLTVKNNDTGAERKYLGKLHNVYAGFHHYGQNIIKPF